MSTVITLPELRASKVFVKENGNISFGTANDYIDPFLEHIQMGKANFKVEVSDAVINAESTGSRNIAYPRVHVQAEFHNGVPDELGIKSVMGMIYALDLQKPIIKVYTGINVSVCMNLTIFNAGESFQQEILSNNYQEVYQKAKVFADAKEKQIAEYTKIISDLKDTYLTEDGLNETMGRLLFYGQKSRLGTSAVVQASKEMLDNSSRYYIYREDKFNCNLWNVYNAVTDVLSNRGDFTDRTNKIVALSKIILN